MSHTVIHEGYGSRRSGKSMRSAIMLYQALQNSEAGQRIALYSGQKEIILKVERVNEIKN